MEGVVTAEHNPHVNGHCLEEFGYIYVVGNLGNELFDGILIASNLEIWAVLEGVGTCR